jgi:hypothetical protein
MQMPGLPAALTRALGRAPWARWTTPAQPHAVTTVMLGQRCLATRVEPGPDGGRPRLVDAVEGDVSDLTRWRLAGLFKKSRAVLVLRTGERHLLTIDRPEVPNAELAMAVRWPVGTALEVEPDELLTTAVPLPRINEAAQPQVLAIAARIDLVRGHLATLKAAGIPVQSVDVTDSALRGMRSLMPADNDGWVVLAMMGGDVCIGLLWRGRFCALRTLSLPVRRPRDAHEFDEHLALHIQRTTDLFERQARTLAIRHVLAALPALSPESRATVQSALPLPTQLFDLSGVFEMTAALQQRCIDHNDLTALACVAAARLHDATNPPEVEDPETSAAPAAAEVPA